MIGCDCECCCGVGREESEQEKELNKIFYPLEGLAKSAYKKGFLITQVRVLSSELRNRVKSNMEDSPGAITVYSSDYSDIEIEL